MCRPIGTAVVLAGGKNRRMGRDKQLLKIQGQSVMDRTLDVLCKTFSQVIVITAKADIYAQKPVLCLFDEIPGLGPIGGLHVALKNADSKYVYLMACDMPVIEEDYIEYLQCLVEEEPDRHAYSGLSKGGSEPFHCVYNRSLIPVIEEKILEKQYSLNKLLSQVDTRFIDKDTVVKFSRDFAMFENINTEAQLEDFIQSQKGETWRRER